MKFKLGGRERPAEETVVKRTAGMVKPDVDRQRFSNCLWKRRGDEQTVRDGRPVSRCVFLQRHASLLGFLCDLDSPLSYQACALSIWSETCNRPDEQLHQIGGSNADASRTDREKADVAVDGQRWQEGG
jgi:hypothetical protein